jgi:hypothetical protein
MLTTKYLGLGTLYSFLTSYILLKNSKLHDRHIGERCFILGNAPSAKMLDLNLLNSQHVISISTGYLHEGYKSFAPRYHCLPQLTYGKLTSQDAIAWFEEMHAKLGDAEIFLNKTERKIIQDNNLFIGRTIHYVDLRLNFEKYRSNKIINIARPIPRVMSAPVLCLMIAMYMGFKKIILIGIDHDDWRIKNYDYAFKLGVTEGKDSVNTDGKFIGKNYEMLQLTAELWRQYRILGQIASCNGIEIINAGVGGELDEFPRQEYQSLF